MAGERRDERDERDEAMRAMDWRAQAAARRVRRRARDGVAAQRAAMERRGARL